MGIAAMNWAWIPGTSYGQEKGSRYGMRLRIGWHFESRGWDAYKVKDGADYFNDYFIYSGLTKQGSIPQVEMDLVLAPKLGNFPRGKRIWLCPRGKCKSLQLRWAIRRGY